MSEEVRNTPMKVTLHFKGIGAVNSLGVLIETVVVPIQKKYPDTEVRISVSA
mgnify:CR=1 FL=1|jgi:hypothetical protein